MWRSHWMTVLRPNCKCLIAAALSIVCAAIDLLFSFAFLAVLVSMETLVALTNTKSRKLNMIDGPFPLREIVFHSQHHPQSWEIFLRPSFENELRFLISTLLVLSHLKSS